MVKNHHVRQKGKRIVKLIVNILSALTPFEFSAFQKNVYFPEDKLANSTTP